MLVGQYQVCSTDYDDIVITVPPVSLFLTMKLNEDSDALDCMFFIPFPLLKKFISEIPVPLSVI